MNTYPIEIWNGGKVQKIRESVIHLMRGQIFEIDGKSFFTMGGAKSSDKKYRKEGLTWWKEEEPSNEEKNEALLNLKKCNNNVNYIITHTCPTSLVKVFDKECYNMPFELDRLSEINSFFEELKELIDFDYWYFGHYHCDIDMDKFNMVFDEIKLIK